jgi:type III pantothenate kinase
MKLNAFLLVDAGNSRIKWARAPMPVFGAPLVRDMPRGAGEMAAGDATAERLQELANEYPERYLVFASVVPRITAVLCRVFQRRFHLVDAGSSALGLDFDYPNPTEIGADRLAAAVAAHEAGQWPAIVISCGTATAFTVLDAKGRLCGGAIAPGLQTQLAALLGATAQLPEITLRRPRSALAKSTQEAIRAGVMLNFQGGANEIIRQLSAALPGRKIPRLILTGGLAHHLAGSLELPHTLRPLLVFEGLRIIGNRIWKAGLG